MCVCVCVNEGTPLGDKTMEVAQKVATDTAEELKKSAAALDREIPGKCHLPYSEKLSREKTFVNRVRVTISWRKLSWNAKPNIHM